MGADGGHANHLGAWRLDVSRAPTDTCLRVPVEGVYHGTADRPLPYGHPASRRLHVPAPGAPRSALHPARYVGRQLTLRPGGVSRGELRLASICSQAHTTSRRRIRCIRPFKVTAESFGQLPHSRSGRRATYDLRIAAQISEPRNVRPDQPPSAAAGQAKAIRTKRPPLRPTAQARRPLLGILPWRSR